MDSSEVLWRAKGAARIAADRARFEAARPRWRRERLQRALAPRPELAPIHAALSSRDWHRAQHLLTIHFSSCPSRFVIGALDKKRVIDRIAAQCPGSAADASTRADRILAGEYDLLGYKGLRFGDRLPDWHLDPVSGRRPPDAFWADVPYLDPASGDHKVIWELNRHQHWLALGRAYWLTGDNRYRARMLDELAGWLDANPPLTGINWASMLELAFRAISWVWTIHLFVGDAADWPWLVDLLNAIDRQLTHVERNLSHYFSPNTHLLGEALALYVCGRALPELAASARRESTGRRILLEQIDRQIAADGGHAERSTHYHRYTLDFYLLALVVARVTGDAAHTSFADAAARLATAARLLADDRGRLPHIGDDDGGMLFPLAGRPHDDVRDSLSVAAVLTGRDDLQIQAAPEEALWMLARVPAEPRFAARQPVRSAALPDTGYYVSRSASEHIVMDGGPHGYRNGGHAHADALSLTLTVHGAPLLIDPGTGCYTIDPALRDRMRSSALHNTVTIDDRSQSLPRGPFHWAHAANARVEAWRANDAFDYFVGVHDGYAPVEHRRRVLAVHGDLVVVADRVGGTGTHAAAAHWHLDPEWHVHMHERRVLLTRRGDRVDLVVADGAIDCVSGDAATGIGWWSPAYGVVQPTSVVRIAKTAAAPFWILTAFGLTPQNSIERVDWVPIWAEAGTLSDGAAVRITRAGSVDHVLFVEPAEPADDAGAADRAAAWRVGEIETDAHALFWRATADRPLERLALVDGSIVRSAGRSGFLLALPQPTRDLHLDFRTEPRVAGAAFGARLVVGGLAHRLEPDRRGDPRL